MKLKSTTTNGFNLRIINSLMHSAFLGGGGYASPALTVNWICRRASPTSIWGSPPPGSYPGRRNNPGLWKTGKIYWSQFGWLKHCANPYFIRQTERTVREPTLLFEKRGSCGLPCSHHSYHGLSCNHDTSHCCPLILDISFIQSFTNFKLTRTPVLSASEPEVTDIINNPSLPGTPLRTLGRKSDGS